MENELPLYNPLDIGVSYDIFDDNNTSNTFTIPSHEIAYFPPHIYKLMEKELINAIINERDLGLNEVYNEEFMNEIRKEIYVESD